MSSQDFGMNVTDHREAGGLNEVHSKHDSLMQHHDVMNKHMNKLYEHPAIKNAGIKHPFDTSPDLDGDILEKHFGMKTDDIKSIFTNILTRPKTCPVNDDKCEKNKQDKIFRTKYAKAMRDYKSAKKNLDILIEEEENTPAFKAEFAKKVRVEGEIESIALLEKHEDLKSEIKKRIKGLSDKKTTNDTMQDLLEVYAIESEEMIAEIEYLENKRDVNNRKSYYEIQQLEFYKKINRYLWWIYWSMVIVLVGIELYMYYKKELHTKGNLSILAGYSVFMICYPFIMNYIVDGILYILKVFYGRIGDNAYMNI